MKKTNIFKRFGAWLKKVFIDPAGTIRHARAIVATLKLIRAAADSPQADALVRAIPGKVDDAILAAVRIALSKVLGVTDALEKLPVVWPSEHSLQNAVLHKTGSEALRLIHDIPETDADLLIQQAYIESKG